MKKILCYFAFAAFLWAGLYLALIAEVSYDSPLSQGGLTLLAAVSFCIAILFMAKGNSLKWKGRK